VLVVSTSWNRILLILSDTNTSEKKMCSASKKASLALICKCPSPTKLNVYNEKTCEHLQWENLSVMVIPRSMFKQKMV
jgi:hypothetical protein